MRPPEPPHLREVAGPVRLETPRLLLREFVEDDWRAARAWDEDAEVARYLPYDAPDEAETRARLAKALARQAERPRRTFEFAITVKATAEVIGRMLLLVERPENGDAMIGFVLRRDRWGQGYVTEAVRATLDFGFDALGLSRIYGDADPRNVGSCRVMAKVGMRREATLLKTWWLKGEWCDSAIFAIRAEER